MKNHEGYSDPTAAAAVSYESHFALACCVKLMLCCDEFWVFMQDEITPNMDAEIRFAKRLGIKIRHITSLEQEVNGNECHL